MSGFTLNRRHFLTYSAAGVAALTLSNLTPVFAASDPVVSGSALGPIQQVITDALDIGYVEAGPENGRAVILLHGAAYDIQSFSEVVPLLAAQGMRVVVPYLRGHGSTRLLEDQAPGPDEQSAVGQDVIDLMNALHIPEAVLGGYLEGGRAASLAEVLKPTRCVGLVSANYLPQDKPSAFAEVVVSLVQNGRWRT
jgi:pimeloyl-ACP methyl ester carboxylesterase